jgi:hypothetical protein
LSFESRAAYPAFVFNECGFYITIIPKPVRVEGVRGCTFVKKKAMKKYIILSAIAITSFTTGCRDTAGKPVNPDTGQSVAETSTETAVEKPLAMPATEYAAAIAAASAKNALPGPKHKELAASEGTWTAQMTYWQTEGAAPSHINGTCEIHMVLGGRYQQSVFKSVTDGVPYEGIGYIAYDNAKKSYISTWIDNTGTGISYLEGGYDPGTKTTEMDGKCVDAYTCKQRGMRQVTRNISKNKQILEMYQTPDGGNEYKSMELVLTKI